MAVTICPTITTDDPDVYRAQIGETANYATRVHIDIGDGVFTRKLMSIEDIWWPAGMRADLHIMFQEPFQHIAAIKALGPQLVIVHAEAEGDFMAFARELHRHGIESGVALLQDTPAEAIVPGLDVIDHVLIFSGTLGQNDGAVDLALLEKVKKLKQLKPQLEFGWDGGANDENVRALADGGIDVVNCGGYLHGENPVAAWQTIQRAVGNE
jgi:ribulose-phosphate 3-epimerase